MAFANSFLRLTLQWQLPGGEKANSSCSWDPSSPLVSLDDATVDALALRASDFWAATDDLYAAAVGYVGSYVSWINTDGTTLARVDRPIAFEAGTYGGNPCPNEVACVMSLRTAVSGRRTRGRMYLPPFGINQLTSDGRWTSTTTGNVADNAAVMLADVVVGGETFTSVVASATGSTMTPVVSVAVGNVPDAQRRRRDRLVEAYHVTLI